MVGVPDASLFLTGYLHPLYAQSLAEFGTPRSLPASGGWILERPIAGFPHRDGMGSYPLFACPDWGRLYDDLEGLEDLVSLSLVTDPFGAYTVGDLQRCFADVVRPFKEHFVVDLHRPLNDFVSKHHRRYARKALQVVEITECLEPMQLLDEWVELYAALVEKHNIGGIRAFSRSAFATQLRIPGAVAFTAEHGGTVVGMVLWYLQGDVGYYHLGAYSRAAYDLRASFALFWHAIECFAGAGNLRWLNLGAGAGLGGDAADGLSRFKRGWATGTRTAYFCGRVFDGEKYDQIVRARGVSSTGYFPAYRKGEFE